MTNTRNAKVPWMPGINLNKTNPKEKEGFIQISADIKAARPRQNKTESGELIPGSFYQALQGWVGTQNHGSWQVHIVELGAYGYERRLADYERLLQAEIDYEVEPGQDKAKMNPYEKIRTAAELFKNAETVWITEEERDTARNLYWEGINEIEATGENTRRTLLTFLKDNAGQTDEQQNGIFNQDQVKASTASVTLTAPNGKILLISMASLLTAATDNHSYSSSRL